MSTPIIRILSLDGGGILGIITLYLLRYIEERSGHPIADLFHFMSGVSTGGLITLGLTKPDDSGKRPAYTAEDIIHLYKYKSQEIFKKTRIGRVCSFLSFTRCIHGLLFSQYAQEGAEKLYTTLFGSTLLSEALTPIMIPAYNIQGTPDKEPRLKIFCSYKKKGNSFFQGDFLMREVAMATSAAPTYFPPQRMHRVTAQRTLVPTPYCLIDGGVAINDPSLLAYIHAKTLYPQAKVMIVSLGLGQDGCSYEGLIDNRSPGLLAWYNKLGRLIIGPQLSTYSTVLRHFAQQDPSLVQYYRIQISFHKRFSTFDDISSTHIHFLERLALDILYHAKDQLDALIAQLHPKCEG